MSKKKYTVQDEIDRLYSKARHDEAQALRHARLQGWEEGILEAREEARLEGQTEIAFTIAKNLLRINFPIEAIAKAIGLSRDEVEKLRDLG